MWRAIVFDIEGVIARQDVAAANRGLDEIRRGLTVDDLEAVRLSAELYPLWQRYSLGELPSAEYWAAVLRGLGLSATADQVRALQASQSATWWACHDKAVLGIIRQLRRRGDLRLATLSNSAPEHEAQAATFASLFDVMHLSHRTGRRKPAIEAYLAVLADLGVPPATAIFIDDKMRNVEAATEAGMVALCFRGAEALATDLTDLGLAVGVPAPDEGAE
jgi:HAD superfamily hydrolase (TIGR01509 family)